MPRLRVQARDLRLGDILVPTGRIVTHAPTIGARTPRAKVDLGLDGRKACFGRYTEITIVRRDTDKHIYA